MYLRSLFHLSWVAAFTAHGLAMSASNVDVYVNPLDYQQHSVAMQVGDPAPPVVVEEWLGVAPAELFQPGTAYVVEFMASWCAPCQKSLPHLSDLADQYRDAGVQFVAIAAAEQGDADELRRLVSLRQQSIRFPVAYVEEAAVYQDWMRAGRTFGLPWVFLVDRQGRIAWWGQPFYADFEPALAALADGQRSDLARLQRELPDVEQASIGWRLAQALEQAEQIKDWPQVLELTDQLREVDLQRYWWEQVQAIRVSDQELGDRRDAQRRAAMLLDSELYGNPHAMTELSELLLHGTPDEQRTALARRAIERASELTRAQNPAVEALREQIRARQKSR